MLLIKIENVGEEIDRVEGAKKIVNFFLNSKFEILWAIEEELARR